MPDLSQIPFGPGVGIFTGQNKDLQYLFDPNAAVYKIDSSRSEWHLLFIRAKNDPGFDGGAPGTDGWEFTLESAPVADVAKIYTQGQAEYDPPRIVDQLGSPISQTTSEDFPSIVTYNDPPNAVEYTVNITDGIVPKNLVLTVQTQYRQHIVQEAGTYIMPIAYHIMTDSGLDIRQVARSDWAFWPMPRHAVWSQDMQVNSFQIAGTTG